MKSRFLIMLAAIALLSCEGQQPSPYHGVLYFAQGAYLMRYSLQDGSLSVAGHLGDTTIREITPLDADQLLVAETASVNRMRVPRISLFNIHTGESADLYAGVLARYLEGPGVVVYDDGSDLYAVPRWDDSANKVIFSHAKNQLTRLVEASTGVVLFESGPPGESEIYSWTEETGAVRKLDGLARTCRLQGAVWIDSLKALACKRRDQPLIEGGYVLSDLDGNAKDGLKLPADRQFRALTWVAGQDLLLLEEYWRGMLDKRYRHAVWTYEVQTGKSERLADDMNLGDSVVFAEL